MDVMHHYQDGPEDPTPPAFERKESHIARKRHHCEECEGWISPGQQYSKHVWMDDEGLHVLKVHADREACAAERKTVEAYRQACLAWVPPFTPEPQP